MNKAKVMLSALGICAILATSFAFTAQKFGTKSVFTGVNPNDCTHEVTSRIITTNTVNGLVYASTNSITSGCTQTYTIFTPLD